MEGNQALLETLLNVKETLCEHVHDLIRNLKLVGMVYKQIGDKIGMVCEADLRVSTLHNNIAAI